MGLDFTIEGIKKNYQRRSILDGCTWTFNENAIYIITGSNGEGKSTLLRICALLESPDSGLVTYKDKGKALNHDVKLMRRITLVLPSVGIFNTSVRDNAAYGLKVRGFGKKAAYLKADEALEYVGLDALKKQMATSLSSGEKQRLGIARAMAIDPDVLFLDEPTASVDKTNVEIIERLVSDLAKTLGSKIIMTTHDRNQAERLGNFLLTLENKTLSGQRCS